MANRSEKITLDSYEHLMINQNANGTITRNYSNFPCIEATSDPNNQSLQVVSKDVTINQSKNTSVRIFLPRQALDSSSKNELKLPVVVYFHGGGFIVLYASAKLYHDLCSDLALAIPAVVVSVDYRLAPEHRLPAAYEDAAEALHWIKASQDEWLQKYANLSSCFLMGDSAGGNIAYHAGLLVADHVDNLLPLNVRGIIMYHPFFGGAKRTESELRLENDPDLPACVIDSMWELSLPLGVDRDHEYSNPTAGGGSKLLEKISSLGWKVMVIGGFGESLVDRQIELLKVMEQKGVKILSHFDDSGHRMDDFNDPVKRKAIHGYLQNFILGDNANTANLVMEFSKLQH